VIFFLARNWRDPAGLFVLCHRRGALAEAKGGIPMKIASLPAVVLGLMMLLAPGVAAEAVEVKVLCASAMRSVMNELGPRFEKTKA
jgi:hypothetical protein